MEYTWKVTGMKIATVNETEGVVVQTYWTKTGKDENGNEGVFSGATPFKDGNPTDPNFVPFNQLTEEIVLNWIKAVVVGDYEQHVNDQIQKQISRATVTEATLPWATPATESK